VERFWQLTSFKVARRLGPISTLRGRHRKRILCTRHISVGGRHGGSFSLSSETHV